MEEKLDAKIKKGLSRLTNEFSSADVEFIKHIDFPKKITLIEKDDEIRSCVVDNLDELLEEFKKIEGKCMIVIPALEGKMMIQTAEEK